MKIIYQFSLVVASAFLLLTGCSDDSWDISGHWHLYAADKKGNMTNESLAFTLDVMDNKMAFFNLLQLTSPDRNIFEKYMKGSGEVPSNVDSLLHTIAPYAGKEMPEVITFEYEFHTESELLLEATHGGRMGNVFLARRSGNCQEDDYCQLNPDIDNWCGMSPRLPAIGINDENINLEKSPEYDIFLGFLEESRIDGIEKQIALNFNREKDFAFAEFPEVLETATVRIPSSRLRHVTFNLFIDEAMPFFVVDYLQNHLTKAGFTKIAYQGADGNKLFTRIPPFVENGCDPVMKVHPCVSRPILTDDEKAELQHHQLAPQWVPVIRYQDVVLKPENLFILDIDATGTATLNGDVISKGNIPQMAREFLEGGNPATKVFRIVWDSNTPFGDYVEVFAHLRRMYDDVWNDLAVEMFSVEYDKLNQRQLGQLRSKVPQVISVQKK